MVGSVAGLRGSGGGVMNKKGSRGNLLGPGTHAGRLRKAGSRNKLRDSDEEAQSLLHGASSRGARVNGRGALTGEAEQDGDFDQGWSKDDDRDRDEEEALLEEGRRLVSGSAVVIYIAAAQLIDVPR